MKYVSITSTNSDTKFKKGDRIVITIDDNCFLATVTSIRHGKIHVLCDNGDTDTISIGSKRILGNGITRKIKKSFTKNEAKKYMDNNIIDTKDKRKKLSDNSKQSSSTPTNLEYKKQAEELQEIVQKNQEKINNLSKRFLILELDDNIKHYLQKIYEGLQVDYKNFKRISSTNEREDLKVAKEILSSIYSNLKKSGVDMSLNYTDFNDSIDKKLKTKEKLLQWEQQNLNRKNEIPKNVDYKKLVQKLQETINNYEKQNTDIYEKYNQMKDQSLNKIKENIIKNLRNDYNKCKKLIDDGKHHASKVMTKQFFLHLETYADIKF